MLDHTSRSLGLVVVRLIRTSSIWTYKYLRKNFLYTELGNTYLVQLKNQPPTTHTHQQTDLINNNTQKNTLIFQPQKVQTKKPTVTTLINNGKPTIRVSKEPQEKKYN